MRVLWDTLRKYPALLMLVVVYVASTVWVASNYIAGRGGTGAERTDHPAHGTLAA